MLISSAEEEDIKLSFACCSLSLLSLGVVLFCLSSICKLVTPAVTLGCNSPDRLLALLIQSRALMPSFSHLALTKCIYAFKFIQIFGIFFEMNGVYLVSCHSHLMRFTLWRPITCLLA
jgi:hypothetical protein